MSTLTFLRGKGRAVFVAALVLGASIAQATTVLKMTFSEVGDGADTVAIGTVAAIEETWDAEREMPFTQVTFADVEVLKGQVDGRALTLRFLGGPAPNGFTLTVAGMPQFALKQQTVVFASGNRAQPCPLVGWWQGLYRIVYDFERGAPTVADHAGRPVEAFDGGVGERVVRLLSGSGAPAADALSLDEFRALIRGEL